MGARRRATGPGGDGGKALPGKASVGGDKEERGALLGISQGCPVRSAVGQPFCAFLGNAESTRQMEGEMISMLDSDKEKE